MLSDVGMATQWQDVMELLQKILQERVEKDLEKYTTDATPDKFNPVTTQNHTNEFSGLYTTDLHNYLALHMQVSTTCHNQACVREVWTMHQRANLIQSLAIETEDITR